MYWDILWGAIGTLGLALLGMFIVYCGVLLYKEIKKEF